MGDEEEKEQFRYDEYGNERSEEEVEEKKAQDLKSFLPEEFVPEERASLFGKGSKITLTLDTDKDGGRLSFEVDGVQLQTAEEEDSGRVPQTYLPNVFSMLATSNVYPCICMIPMDEAPLNPDCEPPEAVMAALEKKGGASDDGKGAEDSDKKKKK